MPAIHVNVYVHAPRPEVFARVSDHERFLRGDGIKSCRVTRSGTEERNGLGCIREIRSDSGVHFVEEITHFESPNRYDYLIRQCNLPITHEGGSLRFIERGDGTEIDWVSTFSVRVPLLGTALEKVAVLPLTDQFTRLLLVVKQELEARSEDGRSVTNASAVG